jgi:hypothetical protein
MQTGWRLTLLSLLLAPVMANAENESLPAIHFSIKPHLCVLADGEQACEDQLEVHWSSPEARSLCLYRNGDSMPLQCWTSAYSGHYQFQLTASSSTDFHLREVESEQTLGREVFEVVYQQKQYRRQRRNPWSFF